MRAALYSFAILALSGASLHAQDLVLNGDFAENIMGWETDGTNVTAIWTTYDVNDSPSSGSVQIRNQSPNANDGVVIQQCVPVNSGQRYTYGGKARIPSGPGQTVDNKAVMSVRWYSGPDCTTPNGGSITTGGSPQSTNVWVSQSSTVVARAGSRSAYVRALVTKLAADGSFIAQFDDISMTSPSIFQSGFD